MTRKIDQVHERRHDIGSAMIPPLRTMADDVDAELLAAAATEVQRLHIALGLPRSATLIFGDGEPRVEAATDAAPEDLAAIEETMRAHFEGGVTGDRPGVKVWKLR